MLIDIIGWTLILLFLLFWLFLFYSDAIIRRLTKHADVSWLFYKKVGWIRDNFDQLPNDDAEAARRALFALRLSGGCIILMILIGIVGSLT
jgi:hypothetical protein